MDAARQRQAARRFVEQWTFRRGSEKGEDQQFWNSLLRDVLGVADVESRIQYQVPVPMGGPRFVAAAAPIAPSAGAIPGGPPSSAAAAPGAPTPRTTKFLDAWIPETRVLIEHKSRGVNLDAPQAGHGGITPYEQAVAYDNARPFDEKARWIVTCNFDEFRIHDRARPLAPPLQVALGDLPKEVHRLAFLVDAKAKAVDRELEISVQAGRIVGEIYDALLAQYGEKSPAEIGRAVAPRPPLPAASEHPGGRGATALPSNESSAPSATSAGDKTLCASASLRETNLAALNRLCVRLVFCLYAEDADIFPKDCFRRLLEATPAHYLRQTLLRLFAVLDTPPDRRDPYLEPELAAFPYTNGGLYRDAAADAIPPLTERIRQLLLDASLFDWRGISPTIFGALFESTLNPQTRRAGGMHYTSVANIHRVIDPLFLDALRERVEKELGVRSEELGIAGTAARQTSRRKTPHSSLPTPNSSLLTPHSRRALRALQSELASLTFLDPACGSGNFLTETYLSLRRLENRIIAALQGAQGELDLGNPSTPQPLNTSTLVSIRQFHGIEVNDFAVAVAKTALWIAEAQMLRETADILHREPDFLPLKDYDGIIEGNALRLDWPRTDFIIGNPPFVGARNKSPEQAADMEAVFGRDWKGLGNLDYVTAWYKKAAEMGGPGFVRAADAQERVPPKTAADATKRVPPKTAADAQERVPPVRCAFVSTNSICQGDGVATLWRPLVERHGVEIDFAWRTFRWDSEASDKAHVHCVIIGFHANGSGGTMSPAESAENAENGRAVSMKPPLGAGARDARPYQTNEPSAISASSAGDKTLCASAALREKLIFPGPDGGAHGVRALPAAHINAYLMDAPDAWVESRREPLSAPLPLVFGSMPNDGGHLSDWSPERRAALVARRPAAAPLFRRITGSAEYINNVERWCLWLKGASPAAIRAVPEVMDAVAAVREMRLASKREATRRLAASPTLFGEIRQPDDGHYIVIPRVSSERREYVPMGFLPADIIASDSCLIVPSASLYHFGVLTSSVHMAWMRAVAGRLKSDYRYSAAIVYNNFIWPERVRSEELGVRSEEGGGRAVSMTPPPGDAGGARLSRPGDAGGARLSRPGDADATSASLPAASSMPPYRTDAPAARDWPPYRTDAPAARDWPPYQTDAPAGARDARPYQTNALSATSAPSAGDKTLYASAPSEGDKTLYASAPSEGDKTLCASASLRETISQTAQAILDVRARYPDSSLADLYDPLTMPADLRAAHAANDRAVLAAYGWADATKRVPPGGRGATALPANDHAVEAEIVARLFRLYAAMTGEGRNLLRPNPKGRGTQ